MSGLPDPTAARPGWFPDPSGRHEYRYHNGATWTADVSDDGARYVDPWTPGSDVGTGASPSGPGQRNRLAVASLVLGVLAIGLGILPFLFVVGVAAAVLAITFGAIGLRRAAVSGTRRSFAIAGIVTGVAGLLAAVVGALLTSALIDAVDRFENPGAHEATIVSCQADGDAWIAAGELTNLEGDERDYLLSVEFRRPGTDNAQITVRVELDDVAAGATRTFEVRRAIDLDEVECAVGRVDGPAPFGIDIGR